MKSLKLIIEGQPISKQSVKQGRSWKGKKVFYQPAKYKLIELKYKYQIKAQLPPGFQMFTKKVYIEKLQFVFQPLAKHLKIKKNLALFAQGGTIEKTTRPDLSDNLKKLLLDSMQGLVFKDDCLICKENNISKVYGQKGCIIIHLKGI
tara:strand:+ start:497 stop:940 length:444 start_codon:yes stop_codon:yes gene_type:complete